MGLKVQLDDEAVDGLLAMDPLYLGQYQASRIAVVAAAHLDVHGQELAGAFDFHFPIFFRQRKGARLRPFPE